MGSGCGNGATAISAKSRAARECGQGKSGFAAAKGSETVRPVRYFDHNATHPVSSAARTAWLDALDRFPANPSSPHRWGSRAAKALEDARESVALHLGVPAAEVAWTSGATESNNALVRHLAAGTTGPVLVSATEHPSVQAAAARWLGDRVVPWGVDRRGVADLGFLADRLRDARPAAVVLMAANNETGVLQPVAEAAALCAERGVPLMTDAVQWVGKLPPAGLASATMLSASGHKFGGPQGVGLMRVPRGFRASQVGGPQEEGRRAGTENVAGILAFAAALASTPVAGSGGTAEAAIAERRRWRDDFLRELAAALPGTEVVGEGAERLWNTAAVLMPPAADCRRRWVVKLDRLGWAVSTGSACSSGKEVDSPVLAAMGRRPDESDRMLRFSAGWETTEADWRDLLAAVLQAARELVR